MNAVKMSNNPTAMLNEMAQTNPKLKEILDMTSSNKSPKDLFYEKANQMGIDPEVILSQLR